MKWEVTKVVDNNKVDILAKSNISKIKCMDSNKGRWVEILDTVE